MFEQFDRWQNYRTICAAVGKDKTTTKMKLNENHTISFLLKSQKRDTINVLLKLMKIPQI